LNIRGELTAKDRERIWNRTARPTLKKRYEQEGITYCLRCGNTNALSFGHRLKRRHIHTIEELYIAALLCTMGLNHREGCHTILEHSPTMFEEITELLEIHFPAILTASRLVADMHIE
jgi:hypothetical protein